VPGGAWVFAVPVEIPALWGAGREVGWSEGEPIIVVGSDGSGKTVFCWNLVLRQLGIIGEPLASERRSRHFYGTEGFRFVRNEWEGFRGAQQRNPAIANAGGLVLMTRQY
jgi:hypothetical protein